MFKVMIHPADYDNVRPAVDRAFELFPVQIAGKKVLIKPNVLRSSKAAEGIVTHPAVLRAVVEKVEQMSAASIVVGDNPGLFDYGANEKSFKETGLMDAAKGYYQNIGNESQTVAFNPAFMPTVSLSKAVFEADIIISLPKFKTHGLTVITGAIKNRLTPRQEAFFSGNSLFDKIARSVCRAGTLPRKELHEAWEMAKRVRRRYRGGRIVDLACRRSRALFGAAMAFWRISCSSLMTVPRQPLPWTKKSL